ncbi:hypothetical protein [Algoriphagus sp. PAP.12]|uniref:hypothetical protein n=1 Tax=Algoriphagus sp. PAP.12 TaxID=2996678 RepID=UPI00227B3153|nr:hypothetical protein [Algoriphagus sp. PAP.12]
MEIKDSVLVDFLGDYELLDFDPLTDKYLLRNPQTYTNFLEVDLSGNILTEAELSMDGKDAVADILGMGYFKGDVTVFSSTGNFMMFDGSEKVGELPLPKPYTPWMNFSKLGLFEIDGNVFYPNPLSENVMSKDGNPGDFFRAIYRMPVLQRQNPETGNTEGMMSMPTESVWLDGKIHGMVFPLYTVSDTHVIYSPTFGNELYVYQIESGQLKYIRTLVVEDPGFVMDEPTDSDDTGEYFQKNLKHRPGQIGDILIWKDYYLVVYKRGVSELKMPTKIEGKDREYYQQIEQMNPFYAAVYDKNLNLLASGIPFPKSIRTPRVVNSDGEIVVSKDPNLSEIEDDGIVLYLLDLKIQ